MGVSQPGNASYRGVSELTCKTTQLSKEKQRASQYTQNEPNDETELSMNGELHASSKTANVFKQRKSLTNQQSHITFVSSSIQGT